MKLHITGVEEAIEKIVRLKEILGEAERIIWSLHVGTSFEHENEENGKENPPTSAEGRKMTP